MSPSFSPKIQTRTARLFRFAFGLAVFTIFYNIAEGLVSLYFGYTDDSLALFGFGIDSFIEVLSGLGIAHMILRIRQNPESRRDEFERTALRITGIAFYLLTGGLLGTSVHILWTHGKPETTFWGVLISSISILVMILLLYGKRTIGRELNSDAIRADAECTKICISMSLVLLLSSAFYALTSFAYADVLGSLGLAILSFREGRECFEKTKGNLSCSCQAGTH